MQLLVNGVKVIADFAAEINKKVGYPQIRVLDIGGGLPVNYDSEETTPTYKDYATALQASVPQICTGDFLIITEFGRSLVQKCGWAASKGMFLASGVCVTFH